MNLDEEVKRYLELEKINERLVEAVSGLLEQLSELEKI